MNVNFLSFSRYVVYVWDAITPTNFDRFNFFFHRRLFQWLVGVPKMAYHNGCKKHPKWSVRHAFGDLWTKNGWKKQIIFFLVTPLPKIFIFETWFCHILTSRTQKPPLRDTLINVQWWALPSVTTKVRHSSPTDYRFGDGPTNDGKFGESDGLSDDGSFFSPSPESSPAQKAKTTFGNFFIFLFFRNQCFDAPAHTSPKRSWWG